MRDAPVDYETFEELQTLLTLSLEGRIEPEQAARLEQLTTSDPALRRLYLQMVRDALNLRTWATFSPAAEAASPAAEITSSRGASRIGPRLALPDVWGRRMHPVQFLIWVVALTALGWIGLAGVLRPPSKSPPIMANQASAPRAERVVARLQTDRGARWGATAPRPSADGALRAGQVLNLQSGAIEILYDSGLRMALEGPVRFTLVSKKQGHLHFGRLTAQVPPRAVGFTIHTPVARVVDLGTEFGVAVDSQGATEVHVFYGEVELAALAADPAAPGVVVSAGETRRIAVNAAQVTAVESPTTSYLRPQQLLARKRRALEEQHQRWQAASRALRQDPDLVAYYPCDLESQQAGRLINQAEATAGRHDGLFGDGRWRSEPTWAQGRFPGKPGLEFDALRATCVVIPHHEELQPDAELTLALWFLPCQPRSTYHLVNKAVAPLEAYNLAVAGEPVATPGTLFFKAGKAGHFAPSRLALHRRWTHLAITASAGRQIIFYLDGTPVFQTPVAALGNCAGDVQLGAAPWAPDASFDGVIDELALFRRALGPAEIAALYEAGQPAPSDGDKP